MDDKIRTAFKAAGMPAPSGLAEQCNRLIDNHAPSSDERKTLVAARDEISRLRAEVERLSSRLSFEQRCHRVFTEELAAAKAEIERLTKERDEARDARDKAEAEREAELHAISYAIKTTRFMDPPDGGDVSLAEQVKRMRETLESAEAALAEMRKGVQAAINMFDPWRGVVPLHDALRSLVEKGGETPAARWREEDKSDPFGDRYNCERAALTGGQMTDDELASAVYLDPNIANLTAAKDRIRWLSRKLVEKGGEDGE